MMMAKMMANSDSSMVAGNRMLKSSITGRLDEIDTPKSPVSTSPT